MMIMKVGWKELVSGVVIALKRGRSKVSRHACRH